MLSASLEVVATTAPIEVRSSAAVAERFIFATKFRPIPVLLVLESSLLIVGLLLVAILPLTPVAPVVSATFPLVAVVALAIARSIVVVALRLVGVSLSAEALHVINYKTEEKLL